jgi:Cdc6-like AAA superfamily ATPase
MVVSQEGNRIWLLLESLDPLPEYISSARLIVNKTDLLKRLKEKIEVMRSSSELGLAPKVFGFEPATAGSTALGFDFGERLDEQSKGVLQQCIGSEITFVWGPPGTGKTFTIAALVASLIEAKDTVLVTSHTHAAVEQALWALIEHPSADRQAGFLYNSPLIEEGRILKVGELKSDKFPWSVHLQSYLEHKAKEREDTIQILQEEHERISRHLNELKEIQATWLELEQAEIAYQSLRERHENAIEIRKVTTTQVDNAKTDVDRFEVEHLRAQRSFFIGRRRRIQKSLNALTYAKQALVNAEAEAGHAEANAIRTERVLAEAHANLLRLQQLTDDLKPRTEVEEEITDMPLREHADIIGPILY